VERQAMDAANLVVGEVNAHTPASWGILWFIWMNSTISSNRLSPALYTRWPLEDIFLKIAANIANVIEDGSCISLGIGPLYEALSVQLATKKHLGVSFSFFYRCSDGPYKEGAVTNRRKGIFRGKSSRPICWAVKK